MSLIRAEHRYGSYDGVDPAFAVEHFYVQMRREAGEIDAVPREPPARKARKVPATTTVAYVNYGRWVADCPFCHSAQVVTPNDARWFCVECANAPIAGAWATVAFPSNHAEIEGVLDEIPQQEGRHWTPGQSVADTFNYAKSMRQEAEALISDEPAIEVVGRGSADRRRPA